jgi:hypothetical protein
MLDVDTSGLEKLAVLPVQLDGASERDADTLAQILSIELMRNKTYAIYPRTASLEKVRQEFDTQKSSANYQEAAQLGRGETPRLVLSVAARKLGASNRFNASIIDLEDGMQIQGTSEEYVNMSDGMTVMRIIAGTLSGQDVSVGNREWWINFNKNARLVFALQMGVSTIPEDIVSARIFGEPVSEYDTDTKNSDGTTTSKEAPPGVGLSVPEFLVGFQYSWFSIDTGISYGFGYDGPSQMEYSLLQVPLLLRGEFFNFLNIFVGIGFNIPLAAKAKLAKAAYGSRTTYDATLSMSPSLLCGFMLSPWVMEDTAYSIGVEGGFDLAETKVKLEDGRTGSFSRGFTVTVLGGFKFRRPLLGNNNSFQGVPQNQGRIQPTSTTPSTW